MSVVLPIEENSRYRVYVASGGQTDFSIPFPFQQNDDISVSRRVAPGDWRTVAPTLYSISGARNPAGGMVTFHSARAGGELLLVSGAAVLDRLGSIVREGRYNSKLTDDELDRNRLIQQELARDIRRAITMEWDNSESAPPMIASNIEEGQSLIMRAGRIEGGLSIDEIGEASEAAVEAREAAQIAREAAEAAQNSVIDRLGPALPQTYNFDVGDGVQSADLGNPAITKAHILSLALGGVEQMEDTFAVAAGVVTPVGGSWPVAALQVKVGIGLPVSLAAAIPIAGSVRDVHVAGDAGIDTSKITYRLPAAPEFRRSLEEKLAEQMDARDFLDFEDLNNPAVDVGGILSRATRILCDRGGGSLLLPDGELYATDVHLYSDVIISGRARYSATLKGVPGSPKDIILGYDRDDAADAYDYFASPSYDVTKGASRGGVRCLTIDGNFRGGALGPTFAVWGYALCVQDVLVKDSPANGLRTAWSDGSVPMEGKFADIVIDTAQAHGWSFAGPHDSHVQNVIVVDASQDADGGYSGRV